MAPATIGEILPPGVPATPLPGFLSVSLEPDPASGEPCICYRSKDLTFRIR